MGQLLKEEFSPRKFFPIRVDPFEEGGYSYRNVELNLKLNLFRVNLNVYDFATILKGDKCELTNVYVFAAISKGR